MEAAAIPSPKEKEQARPKEKSSSTAAVHFSSRNDLFEHVDDAVEDPTAFQANDGDDEYEEDWSYPEGRGDSEEHLMAMNAAEASLKDVELDVFTAFLGTNDFDQDDQECMAFLSGAVQASLQV